jgi:hypothetical protein
VTLKVPMNEGECGDVRWPPFPAPVCCCVRPDGHDGPHMCDRPHKYARDDEPPTHWDDEGALVDAAGAALGGE